MIDKRLLDLNGFQKSKADEKDIYYSTFTLNYNNLFVVIRRTDGIIIDYFIKRPLIKDHNQIKLLDKDLKSLESFVNYYNKAVQKCNSKK